MAHSDLKDMSEDDIAARMVFLQAELKKAKDQVAATEPTSSSSNAQPEAPAKELTPAAKKAASRSFFFPAKSPPMTTFMFPVLMLYGMRKQVSTETWCGALFCFMLFTYLGHCMTEYFDNSEWRTKLRDDADERCKAALDGKLDEHKKKKDAAGSSKKKSKKVE